MTRSLRVALLATAIIFTPAASSAAALIDARLTSSTSADSQSDAAPTPETVPGPIHWAMIAVGAAFAGAAFYIQRRRGFDRD
jgi:hypothetical protein